MIKEAYCSFKVSKLLKEKGFNEKCRGGYHSEFDDNDNSIIVLEEWMAQPYNNDFVDEGFLCSAPTHQMAMKWLREVYKLPINIWYDKEEDIPDDEVWASEIAVDGPSYILVGSFASYEDAVEAALKYTLENLI